MSDLLQSVESPARLEEIHDLSRNIARVKFTVLEDGEPRTMANTSVSVTLAYLLEGSKVQFDHTDSIECGLTTHILKNGRLVKKRECHERTTSPWLIYELENLKIWRKLTEHPTCHEFPVFSIALQIAENRVLLVFPVESSHSDRLAGDAHFALWRWNLKKMREALDNQIVDQSTYRINHEIELPKIKGARRLEINCASRRALYLDFFFDCVAQDRSINIRDCLLSDV